MGNTSVLVAVPNRGSVSHGTAAALLRMGRTPVHGVRFHSSSLLTLTFNSLWATALNERPAGVTHFVMLHDDVVPLDDGWLDALVGAFAASGADVLSAVVPIKDARGLTSTAFLDPRTRAMTRLTATEAVALPPTFDAAAAGHPGRVVLPNTGLWVCDFTRPWVERVCFTMRDRLFRDAAGHWVAQCYSEDWDFGVQCHALGLRVAATTAVRVVHKGGFDYPNFAPWGSLAADDQTNVWDPPDRTYRGT